MKILVGIIVVIIPEYQTTEYEISFRKKEEKKEKNY